jgi:hypothetical protein
MSTPEILPKFLSARDVETWLLQFGMCVHHEEISQSLRLVPIPGCIVPARRGQRCTIPKAALLQLLVVCLARRSGRRDVWPIVFDRVYLDAAEVLLRDPDVAPTVPPALKEAVKARRKARKGRLGVAA